MTIIVYDRASDRVFSDRCYTAHGSSKARSYEASKVIEGLVFLSEPNVAVPYKYASAGTLEDSTLKMYVEAALRSYLIGSPGELPFSVSFARLILRLSDTCVLTTNDVEGGRSVLCNLVGHDSEPFAIGSGCDHFNAYFDEHRNVEKALELTCTYAYGCGYGLDVF